MSSIANTNLLLIKIGGSVLAQNNLFKLSQFTKSVSKLKSRDYKIILVHGAGPQLSATLKKKGVQSIFAHGQRYTSIEMINVAQKIFVGEINQNLVFALNNQNNQAIGLSGLDANLLLAEKVNKIIDGIPVDLGQVGRVSCVKRELLINLLDLGYLPVIAPLAVSNLREKLNVNADLVAGKIAADLKVKKMILISDIAGVYEDWPDKQTMLSQLTSKEASVLLENIDGGMIPKLEAGLTAISNGVREVVITDSLGDELVDNIVNNKPLGTKIVT